MFSRQGRDSGDGKHKGRTGEIYRCLKCMLLCFAVNLSAQSTTEQPLRTACPTLWSCLSTPWPLVPLAATRLHTIPCKDAGVCGHCWGSQGPGHIVESHLPTFRACLVLLHWNQHFRSQHATPLPHSVHIALSHSGCRWHKISMTKTLF